MKKMKMKSILLLTLMVAVIMGTIGGTVAYLVTSTDPVKNVFTPSEVTTEIEEKVDDGRKSKIIVKNTGDVDVWVRVAIIGNYVKDGQVVGAWNGTVSYNSTKWTEGEDGYYYYSEVVKVGSQTENLLSEGISFETRDDGSHLEITVIHQSIQAGGMDEDVNSAQNAFAKASASSN